MTTSLLAVVIRHERRVQLAFSQPLGSGAFVTSLYSVTSLDARSASPSVLAALLVPNSPAVVELALDSDLAKGGMYQFSAIGVPGQDLSVTGPEAVETVRYSLTAPRENVEPIKVNRDRLVYGVDLIWNGSDFQESPTGDLDRVGGTANVTKALYRRAEADSLPWDETYGVGLRDFVDSPSVASGTLRGKLSSQLLRDPRVKKLSVTAAFEDESTLLHATPTLVSGETITPVTLIAPTDG